MIRRVVALGFAVLATACVGPTVVTTRTEPADVAGDGHASTLIREAFVTALAPDDNIDSIATWISPEGDVWLIATAKETGRLVVFDGNDGRTLLHIGRPGAGAGEFSRPNGIAVFGDYVFVVERDNHRVQVLELPEFEPRGVLGADVLRSPYGLWLEETAPGRLALYVTDSFQPSDGAPPTQDVLSQRVRLFDVQLDFDDDVTASLVRSFGDIGAGAIVWIESIVGDPLHGRLLIPEEFTEREPGEIRVYDLQGEYQQRDIGRGLFGGQPEGLALYDCADGSGYWIATDQQEIGNRFHVFDRRSLIHIGTFSGETARFTDGVSLHPHATARFPDGVFYAVHKDQGVVAFDWRDIAQSLALRPGCGD